MGFRALWLIVLLSFLGCATSRETSETPEDRQYVNPIFRWSVSYPRDWVVDDHDLIFVGIPLPSSHPHARVGLHSGLRGVSQSFDEFVDAHLDAWNREMRRQGLEKAVITRQTGVRPDGMPMVEVLHRMGTGAVGQSRKVYTVAEGQGILIDAETSVMSWPEMSPYFDRIIRSFAVPGKLSGPTIVLVAALTLSEQHVKQPGVVRLLKAAVGGLRESLRSAGIPNDLADLTGTDEPTAVREFQAEFDRASKLAGTRLDERRLQYAAVVAMAASVGDSHTQFFPPDELRAYLERLHGRPAYAGIGAMSIGQAGHYYVWHVYAGGPAARVGLQPFDRVTPVDGEAVDGRDIREVSDRVRGREGTTVRLTVQRPGHANPLVLSVIRGPVRVPPIGYATLSGGIGLIRLLEFNPGAASDMARALDDLQREGVRGLVLDLRENVGGLTDELDQLASLLLAPRQIVYMLQARHRARVSTTTGGPRLAPTVPVAVLINATTASSAEVLAAAMRDHGRGVLVGARTNGATGSARLFRLPGDTGIEVTTARIMTSSGVDLEGHGLSPDIAWDLSPDDLGRGVDSQLRRALEILGERDRPTVIQGNEASRLPVGNLTGRQDFSSSERCHRVWFRRNEISQRCRSRELISRQRLKAAGARLARRAAGTAAARTSPIEQACL